MNQLMTLATQCHRVPPTHKKTRLRRQQRIHQQKKVVTEVIIINIAMCVCVIYMFNRTQEKEAEASLILSWSF